MLRLSKLAQYVGHVAKYLVVDHLITISKDSSVAKPAEGRSMLHPAEIIRDTIHSAFVKYPLDDDPDWSHHWITVEDSDQLTKAVLLRLKSNGFEIVGKGSY